MHFDGLWMRTARGVMLGALCCADPAAVVDVSAQGELVLALGVPPGSHDVTAVRIDVVSASDDCAGAALASETVPLSPEMGSSEGDGAHPYARRSFVLPAGEVRVCAAPLASELPSESCAPSDVVASVTAGQTTEVSLVSQCRGAGNGAVHAVIALNEAPVISELGVAPSSLINVCESATLSLTATDPEGDSLTYAWSTGDALRARPYEGSVVGDGPDAIFSARLPGDYVVNVVVSDTHGGHTTFSLPMHVSDAVCGVPPEVQDIFTTSCGPCHASGNSGGLTLDSAESSLTNLVGQAVRGVPCTSAVRVVPGNSSMSYLVGKLRGSPGICGQQMPRGLPPLPEEQLQLIEAWIDGL